MEQQVSGNKTLTKEEYQEANIRTLNTRDGETHSGQGGASGEFEIHWSVSWNDSGFTGYSWELSGMTFDSTTAQQWIDRGEGYRLANAISGNLWFPPSCGSLVEL